MSPYRCGRIVPLVKVLTKIFGPWVNSIHLYEMKVWSMENNLVLNSTKMKEIVFDFRRMKAELQTLFIGRYCVERISNFWFLGVRIENELPWSSNNTRAIIPKVSGGYFLMMLRNVHHPQKLLMFFFFSDAHLRAS